MDSSLFFLHAMGFIFCHPLTDFDSAVGTDPAPFRNFDICVNIFLFHLWKTVPAVPNVTDLGNSWWENAMKTHDVTIIICCYNSSGTLPETLESLQAQSHEFLEILVVDDASTDETPEIVKRYQASDPRIRMVTHGRNMGLAHGRKTGVENASHELLTFIDADDIAMPNMVKRFVDELMSDQMRLGVSSYRIYFDDERDLGLQKIGPTTRKEYINLYKGEKLVFLSYPNLVRKKDVLAVGGYRVDVMPNPKGIRHADFCEDLDIWCRMSDLSADGRYFITLKEPLSRYRKPMDSMSTKNLKHMQTKMRWIKDCLRRRRAGHDERSLSEFIASRNSAERFADWRSDKAAGFYKQAGFSYAKRNFIRLAYYLILTGLMSPKLVRQKIATQKVTK
jgi:glycosyltransferase involved in cell wall biosynthesis